MRSWNSVGLFNVKMIKGDSGSQNKSQMGCCPYHCCYAVLDWQITAQGERIYTAFEVYRKFKQEMLVVGSLLNIVGCWLLDSFVYSQQHRYTHITYTVVIYSSYSHNYYVCVLYIGPNGTWQPLQPCGLLQDTHKYDCTDVARDLLKRAEKFKLKSIRMPLDWLTWLRPRHLEFILVYIYTLFIICWFYKSSKGISQHESENHWKPIVFSIVGPFLLSLFSLKAPRTGSSGCTSTKFRISCRWNCCCWSWPLGSNRSAHNWTVPHWHWFMVFILVYIGWYDLYIRM